jgi:phosphohistidine swiveling domain-containing protein
MKLFTAAREHYKFVFTRTLSDMLELIKEMGEIIGIPAGDIACLEMKDIFALFNVNPRVIRDNIAAKKAERIQWDRVILPPLIFRPADFWIVQAPQSHPNFVTNKSVEGEIIVLEGDIKGNAPIEDKIVFIENADPGFHWIFSCNIRGLVTKYGGVGSHMTICCAEFNIPAAIGCGELYDRLKMHRAISLDCANRVIN